MKAVSRETGGDELGARVAELERRLRAAGKHVTVAGFVDEATAAAVLDTSVRTMQRRRRNGTGPAAYRGPRVLYALATLIEYLDRQTK